MALWVLKGGRGGERERRMIEESTLAIGWQELPDMTAHLDRQAIEGVYQQTYPDSRDGRMASHVNQLEDFLHVAHVGELVLMPLKSRPAIAVGEIAGDYTYRTDLGPAMAHTRPVRWIRTSVAREAFDSRVLEACDTFATFRRVDVEGLEEEVRRIAEDPATVEVPAPAPTYTPPAAAPERRPARAPRGGDIESHAREQIVDAVGRRFRGRGRARLVEELLRASGLATSRLHVEEELGPVEILAAPASPGAAGPKICVEVEPSERTLGSDDLRRFREQIDFHQAELGLLVAWGGFDSGVRAEARDAFFRVRLWDAREVAAALVEHYDRLSEDVRQEVPLRRIWCLSPRRH